MAKFFNDDILSSERYWQNDAEARDRAFTDWDELQNRDVEIETEAEAGFDDARREAAEATYEPRPVCDGSGILEERMIDVDQAEVVECPGCPACELAAKPERKGDNRPLPAWMEDEPELVEFQGAAARRKAIRREVRKTSNPSRKEVA